MTLSTETGRAGTSDRPGFWGRLSTFGPYTAVTDVLLSSPRRQFWFLLTIPILWVFVTHLGPIL